MSVGGGSLAASSFRRSPGLGALDGLVQRENCRLDRIQTTMDLVQVGPRRYVPSLENVGRDATLLNVPSRLTPSRFGTDAIEKLRRLLL